MSRVVRGTGIAVAGKERDSNDPRGPSESPEIQKAMENAALSCAQEGITDDNEIRKRVDAARERARKFFRTEIARTQH